MADTQENLIPRKSGYYVGRVDGLSDIPEVCYWGKAGLHVMSGRVASIRPIREVMAGPLTPWQIAESAKLLEHCEQLLSALGIDLDTTWDGEDNSPVYDEFEQLTVGLVKRVAETIRRAHCETPPLPSTPWQNVACSGVPGGYRAWYRSSEGDSLYLVLPERCLPRETDGGYASITAALTQKGFLRK